MPGDATMRDLVAAGPWRLAKDHARAPTPGFSAGGTFGPHEDHQPADTKQLSRSSPITRGGHHAEVRQHRVAPADAGLAEGDAAEAHRVRDLLQLRAGSVTARKRKPACSGPQLR